VYYFVLIVFQPLMNTPSNFIEIRLTTKVEPKPDRIDVIISTIDPKICSRLLKELSMLTGKDESLSHLKRVRRRKEAIDVLLGRHEDTIKELLGLEFDLKPRSESVPGRSAESDNELKEFNAIWPTFYFKKNTEEQKDLALVLSDAEHEQMMQGMKMVFIHGAVIMDPKSGFVVSRSEDEILFQPEAFKNPFSTPVILALQGVSRSERKLAQGKGMESPDFQNGQYLCTGYDIYVHREPSIFEAMALLHSRIRHVVFAVTNETDGGLGGTGEATAVNLLPSTNHKFRVFRYLGTNGVS
jgi:tRNA-specific adenosine deaminase 3